MPVPLMTPLTASLPIGPASKISGGMSVTGPVIAGVVSGAGAVGAAAASAVAGACPAGADWLSGGVGVCANAQTDEKRTDANNIFFRDMRAELRFPLGMRIRHATGCRAYARGKRPLGVERIIVVGDWASYKSKFSIVFILTYACLSSRWGKTFS